MKTWPRGERVEAGEAVHQRRLARARRAHDGGEAGGEVDGHAVEGADLGLAPAVDLDGVDGRAAGGAAAVGEGVVAGTGRGVRVPGVVGGTRAVAVVMAPIVRSPAPTVVRPRAVPGPPGDVHLGMYAAMAARRMPSGPPVPYLRPVRSLLARRAEHRQTGLRRRARRCAGRHRRDRHQGERRRNSPTHPNAFAYVLVLVCTLALLWRRRYPTTVMVVVLGTTVTITAIGFPDGGTVIAALIAFYSAAAYGRRRRTSIAALTFAASMAVLWLTRDTSNTSGQDLLSNVFVFGAAWAFGEIMRTRRERIATLEARATALERERIDEAERAVADERLRIARELHDVVAHAMSVITVQAGVGAHVIDTQPEEAKRALEAIETTGRSALQELRRMLGVLRSEEAPRGLRAPVPVIDAIEALAQTVRATGTSVEIRWVGDGPRPCRSASASRATASCRKR